MVESKHPAVLVTPYHPTQWEPSGFGFFFFSLHLNQTNQPITETSFMFSRCSFCMCEVEHSGTEKHHIYRCPCCFSCVLHVCVLQLLGFAGWSQVSVWPALEVSQGNVASEMGACRFLA